MKPALPALLLGLLASTAALNVNRRDALKGTTASVAQIALPTASLAQVAMPAPAVAAAPEKLAVPKMGIGAWAWGDSLFWSTRRPCAFDVTPSPRRALHAIAVTRRHAQVSAPRSRPRLANI